jgi:hypothetical protein
MAMVGHRSDSIYRRYQLADETMLKESAAKLAALRKTISHILVNQGGLEYPFERPDCNLGVRDRPVAIRIEGHEHLPEMTLSGKLV